MVRNRHSKGPLLLWYKSSVSFRFSIIEATGDNHSSKEERFNLAKQEPWQERNR